MECGDGESQNSSVPLCVLCASVVKTRVRSPQSHRERRGGRRTLQSADAAIPRPGADHPGSRDEENRPHRYGHDLHLRASVAVRPGRGLSAGHDEESPPALHHLRAALVPRGRHERPLPQREQGHDLGRVGGRERGAGAGLRLSVALLAGRGRAAHRPDHERAPGDPPQPRLAPPRRQRVERGRSGPDGLCSRVTRCSSSTSRTGASPASCTSAAPTSSSASRSTSPRTRF